MARSRRLNVFSLSFLDVMSCGFGAVVLIFLIINHSTDDQIKEINNDLLSEIRLLDYEIKNGQLNLIDFQKQMEDLKRRGDGAKGVMQGFKTSPGIGGNTRVKDGRTLIKYIDSYKMGRLLQNG